MSADKKSEIEPNPPGNSEIVRLKALAGGLRQLNKMMRYVDYRQAEHDCGLLAVKLLALYSRQELKQFAFTAVPRGGIIILGMLAYVLDLQPAQLQAPMESSQPLVIVDDCALTGARFIRFLAQTASSHVVFAHLYSHPDLRRALLDRESRLNHCTAAHDLKDHSREHYPSPTRYKARQEKWKRHMGPDEAWHGQPDLVCFPWSEPGRVFWNPVTGRKEDGWRFLPPHLCLKNKTGLHLPPKAVPEREWQIPLRAAYGSFDNVLWLCRTDAGQVYSLNGISADMWRALAAYGNLDAAVEYLLNRYETDEATLRSDLHAFTGQLLGKGLLEKI